MTSEIDASAAARGKPPSQLCRKENKNLTKEKNIVTPF